MRMERSTASRRAPKARVDSGGNGWREREDAGESESEENETNTWIWSYLRARGRTAVLQETLATWIGHRSSGLRGGGGERARAWRGKGEEGGPAGAL